MLCHLLGRENRFGRITCHSRTFFFRHTLTLLGSVVKFHVFLVGHLVQATNFCEQASASIAGAGAACPCCAGAAPHCPTALCAGHSWGKICSP